MTESKRHRTKADIETARELSMGVSWRTILLWMLLVFIYFSVGYFAFIGELQLPIASIVNTIACYYFFIVMHEAIHENVNGGIKKLKSLNAIIGHSSSVPLGLPLIGYGKLHIAHHKYANSKMDPDNSCVDGPFSIIEFPTKRLYEKIMVCIPGGIGILKKTLDRKEYVFAYLMYKDKAQVNFYRISFLLFLSSLVFNKFTELVFVWLVPTLAFPYAVFIFLSWFPHIGYSWASGKQTEMQNPHKTAKNNGSKFALIFTGIHHNHLTHHLYPNVQFYKLKKMSSTLNKTEAEYES